MTNVLKPCRSTRCGGRIWIRSAAPSIFSKRGKTWQHSRQVTGFASAATNLRWVFQGETSKHNGLMICVSSPLTILLGKLTKDRWASGSKKTPAVRRGLPVSYDWGNNRLGRAGGKHLWNADGLSPLDGSGHRCPVSRECHTAACASCAGPRWPLCGGVPGRQSRHL